MATDPPLNIFNRRGDRDALTVTQHPDDDRTDHAGLAVWQNASQGTAPGLTVKQRGAVGAAVDVSALGGGPLMNLRNAAGTVVFSVAQDGTYTGEGGGGGITPAFADGYITTGDVTLANVGATWTILTGLNAFQINAVAGDRVEFQPSFMWGPNGSDFLDLAIITGSTIQRFASTGTSSNTTANEGDPSIYPTDPAHTVTFPGHGVLFAATLGAGEVNGGKVTFAVVGRGGGGSKVFASANYPFRYTIRNFKH